MSKPTAPAIGRTPIHGESYNASAPKFRWDGNPMRNPRKGEFYISGAIATAYKAHRDIKSPFFIAVPVPVHETVAQLASEIATLAPPRPAPCTPRRGRTKLRAMATRARQLADDADALARHIDITET